MATDFIPVEAVIDEKDTLMGKIKCSLGFHHWLYLPYAIEISTREVCVRKRCGKWKDYKNDIFKDTGRRGGWELLKEVK